MFLTLARVEGVEIDLQIAPSHVGVVIHLPLQETQVTAHTAHTATLEVPRL